MSDYIEILYDLPLLSNNTASDTFLQKLGAVTGRIRDIEQNDLLSSFQAGSSSNPSYFPIFFLIALLEDTFI
jgi:hypothetical protein